MYYFFKLYIMKPNSYKKTFLTNEFSKERIMKKIIKECKLNSPSKYRLSDTCPLNSQMPDIDSKVSIFNPKEIKICIKA